MTVSIWDGMYGIPWKGIATDACAAHPAKFSKALIFRLVAHAIEEGWLKAGDTAIDCFAGVGLGALPCALEGIVWRGVELEQHFLTLAQDNFALWQRRYGMLPQWRTPTMLQGDSRELAVVLARGGFAACVSSPPHGNTNVGNDDAEGELRRLQAKRGTGRLGREALRLAQQGHLSPHEQAASRGYGTSPAQLGALPPGTPPAMVLSSPPFQASLNTGTLSDTMREEMASRGHKPSASGEQASYGTSPGQLGAMRPGTPPEETP